MRARLGEHPVEGGGDARIKQGGGHTNEGSPSTCGARSHRDRQRRHPAQRHVRLVVRLAVQPRVAGTARSPPTAPRLPPAGPAARPGRSADPCPNAKCRIDSRSGSNRPGRSNAAGSRWAAASSSIMVSPLATVAPPIVMSSPAIRPDQLHRRVVAQRLLDDAPTRVSGRRPAPPTAPGGAASPGSRWRSG